MRARRAQNTDRQTDATERITNRIRGWSARTVLIVLRYFKKISVSMKLLLILFVKGSFCSEEFADGASDRGSGSRPSPELSRLCPMTNTLIDV